MKTTDAYTFPLETAHEYREALREQGLISRESSILIVVGREDTGALEAQVRGSRFAWDIRLIGIEGLIKLVALRSKSDDSGTVRQIHQLLRPFEYTKVDRIIDILFTTATDVEAQQEEEQLEQSAAEPERDEPERQVQEKRDRALIEELKERAIKGFSAVKGTELVRRSRSYFWSADKHLRACCTVSKRYDKDYQPYWYAYHLKWDQFLRVGEGYVILACADLDSAFAVPQRWFEKNEDNLSRSEGDGGRFYWHIPLTELEGGGLAINLTRLGRKYSLEPHRFALAPRFDSAARAAR